MTRQSSNQGGANPRDEGMSPDQKKFDLGPQEWVEFLVALDEPPRPMPHLKALLDEPGFLDEGNP